MAPAAPSVSRCPSSWLSSARLMAFWYRTPTGTLGWQWSWSVMTRRPAFSVFSSVYRFIQKAGRRPFDLWPSVARELRTIVSLAPLLISSMDGVWFRRVMATDASSLGMGRLHVHG